jgi:hypothetical protein
VPLTVAPNLAPYLSSSLIDGDGMGKPPQAE